MKIFHPVTILIFYAVMVLQLMLINNPLFAAVSLIGAVLLLFLTREGKRAVLREFMGYAGIFVIMSLLNPLFVHRGRTPLFFLNGRAVTLEAAMYGVNSAIILVTIVIWCRSFSLVMTSDRLFCLTGKLSPKITAMLTTAVRFISDMLAQGRKISSYSLASGNYNDSEFFGKIKRIMSVFSALVTWTLENGIQTADSMKARGFDLGGRTSYSKYRFSGADGVVIFLSILSAATAFLLNKSINIEFYPSIVYNRNTAALFAAGAINAAAYLFPVVFTGYIAFRRRKLSKNRKLNALIGN